MILAIQTSDNHAHLWLYAPGYAKPRAELSWESGRSLADQLLAKLTEFLAGQGVSPGELTGIAVFSGPGSFTSLRIGHSAANALADSLGIPVFGATGDGWAASANKALPDTPVGQPALPHYGAEANITAPRPPAGASPKA